MGLCSGEKKKRAFRTIIIPRGIINPNEHNIIEIPVSLDTNSNLIVKAPTDDGTCFSVEPYRGNFKDVTNDKTRIETLQTQNASANLQSQSFPGTLNNTTLRPPVSTPTLDALRLKVDTSCQTQFPSSRNYQSSSQQTSNSCAMQSSIPNVEVHSPICPICARASCSFNFSSERSFMHPRYGQYTTPANYYIPPPPINRSYVPPYTDRFSTMPSRSRNEDAELSKLLNDKIDKILKPMLFSLAKSTLDDVEREIEAKPSCSIDSSCSYSFTKPCYEPPYTSKRSLIPDVDNSYDTHRRRESDSNGRNRTRTSFSKNNNKDFESTRRSSVDRDYDDNWNLNKTNCSNNASCNRRTNVSFGEESDKDETQDTDDLYLTASSRYDRSSTSLNRRK